MLQIKWRTTRLSFGNSLRWCLSTRQRVGKKKRSWTVLHSCFDWNFWMTWIALLEFESSSIWKKRAVVALNLRSNNLRSDYAQSESQNVQSSTELLTTTLMPYTSLRPCNYFFFSHCPCNHKAISLFLSTQPFTTCVFPFGKGMFLCNFNISLKPSKTINNGVQLLITHNTF